MAVINPPQNMAARPSFSMLDMRARKTICSLGQFTRGSCWKSELLKRTGRGIVMMYKSVLRLVQIRVHAVSFDIANWQASVNELVNMFFMFSHNTRLNVEANK